MTVLMKGVLQILCLSAVALAIPLSLLEDAKEMRLKAPPRSNKVKRAQEVIMFGNQQNRGSEVRGFAGPKTEKRAASDPDDNTLSDVATLPNIIPQLEENSYDTNQLDAGNRVADLERAYSQYGGESMFNLQLRNVALKEQLYNDPAFSDMALYNMVEARRKREAKRLQSYKLGLRNKRELDLSPEEILSLIKLWQSERRGKMHESRNGWPVYSVDSDDYDADESQEENEIEPDIEYPPNGRWVDGSVVHRPLTTELLWPRQHKRFMVSKRRMNDEGLIQLKDTPSGRIPVYRRLVL